MANEDHRREQLSRDPKAHHDGVGRLASPPGALARADLPGKRGGEAAQQQGSAHARERGEAVAAQVAAVVDEKRIGGDEHAGAQSREQAEPAHQERRRQAHRPPRREGWQQSVDHLAA